MQIIRTILWVIVTAMLVAFIAMNWTKVPVNIWPLDDGNYLHFEWPVGLVALLFFLLGALPMWVVHRAGRWRLKRRIHSLENTVQASAAPVYEPSPAMPAPATTTAAIPASSDSLGEPLTTPGTALDPDYPAGSADPVTGRPL